MLLRQIASLLLFLVCAGCTTMRHQTARSFPHATLEVTKHASMRVEAIWCDGRRLPVDSRRVYRIATGEHQLTVERMQRHVRARSEAEKTLWAAAALGIGLGTSLGGVGAAEPLGRASDTAVTSETYLHTMRFVAAAGQAYEFDGYVVQLKDVAVALTRS